MGGPVNMAGGQPFSMQNLIELRNLVDKYNVKYPEYPIRLIFDATRGLENCEFVRENEEFYKNYSIGELLRVNIANLHILNYDYLARVNLIFIQKNFFFDLSLGNK